MENVDDWEADKIVRCSCIGLLGVCADPGVLNSCLKSSCSKLVLLVSCLVYVHLRLLKDKTDDR